MGRIVVDASIAASWFFRDEATDYTEAALNAVAGSTEAIAPRLWAYEIRNCILTGMRRGRITQPDAEEFLKSLSDLTSRFPIHFPTIMFSPSQASTS